MWLQMDPAQRLVGMSSTVRPGPTFEEAILPHLDAAYNLARWLVRDPAAAEDVVQDACLRALQYFGSFRGENARPWLLQITRNTSYAVLKAKQNRNEVALESVIDDNPEGGLGMDVPDPNSGPEAVLVQQQERDCQSYSRAPTGTPYGRPLHQPAQGKTVV